MIYLIGAGPMALEYSKVLNTMCLDYIVIGRGDESASHFESETGKEVIRGGAFPERVTENDFAINAVAHVDLFQTSRKLIEVGFKNILVEKPGAILFREIEQLGELSEKFGVKIIIGYNRRFLESIKKTKELSIADGGIEFIEFEFSEWMDAARKLDKPSEVHRTWFMANSSHVLDLALYLGGEVEDICASINGNITLGAQNLPSNYCGFGKTKKNIPFSYKAFWDAPGRWGLTVYTKKRKFIHYPLEKLFIQKRNQVNVEEYELEQCVMNDLKPGLFDQVDRFLKSDFEDLLDIQAQIDRQQYYSIISSVKDK